MLFARRRRARSSTGRRSRSGPAMRDASYFLGGGLTVEDRREHEEALVRAYHDELLAHGRHGLRLGDLLGGVPAPAVPRPADDDRAGDGRRSAPTAATTCSWRCSSATAQAVLDLGSLDLLPEPGGTRRRCGPSPTTRAATSRDPRSSGTRAGTSTRSPTTARLGVYHRIGRLPNSDACLLSTCIVRPGRAGDHARRRDRAAAAGRRRHPGDRRPTVLRVEQHCEEPLRALPGRARGHGRGPRRPLGAAARRGGRAGRDRHRPDLGDRRRPLPVAARDPLRDPLPGHRHGHGSASETVALSGPGQRDHSWGARDWWASDWMWSALHLDDGTHTHAVDGPDPSRLRRRLRPARRRADASSSAISSTARSRRRRPDRERRRSGCRRASSTSTSSRSPSARSCSRRPTAASPTSRARCAGVRTADGRSGLGWVEWNRNQR